MAIYQARFNEYMSDRGLLDVSKKRVWAFLGDGECDEPETLGAITLGLARKAQQSHLRHQLQPAATRRPGARQRQDHVQELEGAFRGAGWNVIKVIWGDDWDPLLEQDEHRPARPTDDGSGRRPVPKVRRFGRRVHSRSISSASIPNCWRW